MTQFDAGLIRVEPIPRGICGYLYLSPCSLFISAIVSASFRSKTTSVAEDKKSAILFDTSPLIRVVMNASRASPQAGLAAREARCLTLQSSLYGEERGGRI